MQNIVAQATGYFARLGVTYGMVSTVKASWFFYAQQVTRRMHVFVCVPIHANVVTCLLLFTAAVAVCCLLPVAEAAGRELRAAHVRGSALRCHQPDRHRGSVRYLGMGLRQLPSHAWLHDAIQAIWND